MFPNSFTLGLLLTLAILSAQAAEDRDAKVRKDREDVLSDGRWIYNDLDKGIAESKTTGKPILVVFRCIPCVACAGFDEQVVRYDQRVQDLMERFVRVRIIQGNSMDLTLFQFDYDLSFAAFFMNPDKIIYGRFGTRSDQKKTEKDISIEGFRKALEAALDVHQNYGSFKESLRGKQPLPVKYKIPEEFPALAGKYEATLNYEGQVAKSCIHCHQLRDSERLTYRDNKQPIPDKVLFPWPMPETIGFSLDPREKATVAKVVPGTAAAHAGLAPGDQITLLEGQPMFSIADVQWILQNAPSPARLKAIVNRAGRQVEAKLDLAGGWRRRSDISWRTTTWDLRRMVTGGLVLQDLDEDQRKLAQLAPNALGLRVAYVGQYNAHAAGKNAGFKENDVIVNVDGKANHMSEGELIAMLSRKMVGTKVPVSVLRTGNRVELQLPMQ